MISENQYSVREDLREGGVPGENIQGRSKAGTYFTILVCLFLIQIISVTPVLGKQTADTAADLGDNTRYLGVPDVSQGKT